MYEDKFMKRAIDLSAEALATSGTEPFGAVVVKDGAIIGEGFNHALPQYDRLLTEKWGQFATLAAA